MQINDFFVCVTNSQNIILIFHKKVISHDLLQKSYPNLARTCKNKFYENKIRLQLAKPIKKFLLRQKALPSPVSGRVNKLAATKFSFNGIF